MAERIVISGIGAITPFGIGYQAFADALRAGRSGIAPITAFDTTGCHSHNAATIRGFDPAQFIAPLKMRRIDAVGRLALSCTYLLFDDAGCRPGAEGRDDLGVALGTYTAGLDSVVEYLEGLVERGPTGVPAILFSNTVANAPASSCAIEFGLRGPNVTFNQREASSLAALIFGVDAIRQGKAAAMVTGGADCIAEIFFKAHDRFRALSPMRGASTSEESARPFDRARNGLILGEGGYLLLLEAASSAAARGARVLGEILGTGSTASQTGVNDWPATGEGVANAMRRALADASCDPQDVSAIIAAANGSPVLDRIETDAIATVFGGRSVPVSSVKGAIGETGAAGAGGLVAGLLALAAGEALPTAGLVERDPALAVDVGREARPAAGDVLIVNSVASGGTNCSLVVRASRRQP